MENTDELLTDDPAKHLEYFYTANYAWLENYVLRNSGNVSDAQDVFQDSMAAAWINLKEGRFTGSRDQFNAYIRQICKHKWLNHLKSSAFRKTSLREDIGSFESADLDPELKESQLEKSSQLRRCFEQLGAKCREILGLYYYKRKALSEIAPLMNNTEESIKTIKYRCMMQLRKLFLEKNNDNGQV